MAELPPLPEGFELVPPPAQPQGIPPPPPGFVLVPPKPQQESSTWLGRRLQDVGSVYETAFPDRDPKHAQTPAFTGEGLNLDAVTEIQRAKMSAAGFEDPAWKKRTLEIIGPQRFLELKKDAKDNDIVRYRGDDGKEYEAYLNRPGIDLQDIDRTISGSVPYALAALPVGRATRALGLGGRAVGQGLAAGGVSIGQDIGAGQEVDLGKAGTAATFSAGGEVAGWLIPKVWRSFFSPETWDDAAQTLTPAGRKQAEKLGLNPDEVTAEVGRQLGVIKRTKDPQAAVAGIETGEFGIPTTRGQRSKDPAQLHEEEQMRRSLFGRGARDIITDFDTRQKEAIEAAAGTVRQRVAPQGAATARDAGEDIIEGMSSAREASNQRISDAWGAVTKISPVLSESSTGDAARAALSTRLRSAMDDLNFTPDPEITPQAHRMMVALDDYSQGMPEKVPYKILGDPRPRAPDLDEQRRRLLKAHENATTPQDRAATQAIYSAYTDWIEDLAKGQMVRGPGGKFVSREAAQPFIDARRITREQKARFEPRDQGKKLRPEGLILSEIAKVGDTPEAVAQVLFRAGTTKVPNKGTVKVLDHLKDILTPAQFDQVKAMYFLRMVTGNKGELLSAGHLNNSVKSAFFNQKSVVDKLFDAEEREFIQRFRKAVEMTTYKPPNASGSSYGLEQIRKQRREGPLAYVLKRLGTRATFQGKAWQGTMYHWLARAIPDIAGAQGAMGRSMARKAINEALEFKPDTGEILSALAASYGARKEGNREPLQ